MSFSSLRLAACGFLLAVGARGQSYTFSTFAGQANAAIPPEAQIHSPQGIALDSAGNVYVADADHVILKITPNGAVATFAGKKGEPGGVDGAGAAARFNNPRALVVDPLDNVLVVDAGNSTIRRISPTGTVTRIAGTTNNPGYIDAGGGFALFNQPTGITVDADGNAYVCEIANGAVRRISRINVVSTMWNEATSGYTARLRSPQAIVRDSAGNFFLADAGDYVVKKISPQLDFTVYAGLAFFPGSGDTPAARFRSPMGLALDPNGNLFVTDAIDHTIRKISAAGVVTTVAGFAGLSGDADGAGPDARFNGPTAIAADAHGVLYVADRENNLIRRGLPTGAVPLVFVAQPVSRGFGVGTVATFSVQIDSVTFPTYQWQRRAAGTSEFVPLTDNLTYSGVKTATLNLAPVSAAMDGDEFRCLIDNGLPPPVASAVAKLTLGSSTLFTSATGTSVVAGRAGTFTFAASGQPKATYLVVDGNLPTWATLNAVTGVLSCAPPAGAASGTFLFTVEASNGVATPARQIFSLRLDAAPVLTTRVPTRQTVDLWGSVTLHAPVSGEATYQWKRNGLPIAGATASTYSIASATAIDNGHYEVVATNPAGTVTSAPMWLNVTCPNADIVLLGQNDGQGNTPFDLTAVCSVAVGSNFAVALKPDGTVAVWGSGKFPSDVPAGLAAVVAVAAGPNHVLALRADGTVAAWGTSTSGATSVPTGLTDVVDIAAGGDFSVAVKSDGHVVAWGRNDTQQTTVPATLTNAVAVAAGRLNSLALTDTGRIVAWGNNARVPSFFQDGFTRVAVGITNALAVKADGTMVAWNISTGFTTGFPPGLDGSNVVNVAGGVDSIALKYDGTVVAWGFNDFGQSTVPSGLSQVVSISAGQYVNLLVRDRTPHALPVIVRQPVATVANRGGTTVLSVEVTSDAPPVFLWTRNGSPIYYTEYYPNLSGLTSPTLVIANTSSLDAATYRVIVSNGGGAVTSTPAVVTVVDPPSIVSQPVSTQVPFGEPAVFSVGVSTAPGSTYQWLFNGQPIAGATASTYTLGAVTPAQLGQYALVVNNGATSVVSQPAVLGASTTAKVTGAATEVGTDIAHANGNVYDQLLLTGAAVAARADPGQVLRLSFLDLTDDIVQVEFSGAGVLSVSLDGATGPVAPAKYNQAVRYMKGHASIVLAGADETSNLSVFSVGRANAVNQALFRDDVTYDGMADIASISISSANGHFGGLRTANVSYVGDKGRIGVYAPGVRFTGPVFVGDIQAADTARATLLLGSADDVRITGGDLLQPNRLPIDAGGLAHVVFTDGATSHGASQPARLNQGRFEQNGVDITAAVVVNH